MINLVMSVWISTKGKVSIQYGKVEVQHKKNRVDADDGQRHERWRRPHPRGV